MSRHLLLIRAKKHLGSDFFEIHPNHYQIPFTFFKQKEFIIIKISKHFVYKIVGSKWAN